MSDNEKKFKISVSDGKCPLCDTILRQSFVVVHKVAGREVSPADRELECGLWLNSLTGEYRMLESDIPRAVARKLRGVNG